MLPVWVAMLPLTGSDQPEYRPRDLSRRRESVSERTTEREGGDGKSYLRSICCGYCTTTSKMSLTQRGTVGPRRPACKSCVSERLTSTISRQSEMVSNKGRRRERGLRRHSRCSPSSGLSGPDMAALSIERWSSGNVCGCCVGERVRELRRERG